MKNWGKWGGDPDRPQNLTDCSLGHAHAKSLSKSVHNLLKYFAHSRGGSTLGQGGVPPPDSLVVPPDSKAS